jgi:hypothetical protein
MNLDDRVEAFYSSLKLGFISINVVLTYGSDEIPTTSRTTGIVFLRASSSTRLSTSGLLTVYDSVLELAAAALYDCNPDGVCSDKPQIIVSSMSGAHCDYCHTKQLGASAIVITVKAAAVFHATGTFEFPGTAPQGVQRITSGFIIRSSERVCRW